MSDTTPTYASLVLGSDSFRLLIGTFRDGVLAPLDGQHAPLRLAAALDASGCLDQDAMGAAYECVRAMRTRLAGWTLAGVRAVATSTLRMARNAQAFLPAAQQLLGHPIHILSGEEEGRLTYLGVAHGGCPDDARVLVLGVGGGSTQLTSGHGRQLQRVSSLALGTARVGLTFFGAGVNPVSFAAAIASSRTRVADDAQAYGPSEGQLAFGASGTIHTLLRLLAENGLYDGALNDSGPGGGAPVTVASLEALGVRVLEHAAGGRRLDGLGTLRLRDVAAALAILIALMEELKITELGVPTAGLRAGVLADLHQTHTAATV
jgi:exopolyphosphatase/guanosine-5'-triphosphate,3'-diphosphate pyrophosphatase